MNYVGFRLIPCLSLLTLPTSNGIIVVKYLLEFPEFLNKLSALSSMWATVTIEVSSAAGIFSEERMLGLVSSVLLSALSSQVVPGSPLLVISAVAQEQLLDLISKATTGVVSRLKTLALHRPVVDASTTSAGEGEEDANHAGVPLLDSDSNSKKSNAAQVSTGLLFLSTLSQSLAILVGEGACAPILRSVCASAAWKGSASSTNTLCMILQTLFTSFLSNALTAVKELVIELRSSGAELPEEKSEDDGDMKAEVHPFLIHLEAIKKQLKDLQALTSGATSSKAD